jgi:hypothetical protein
VTGSGVGFRLMPTVPDDAEELHGTEVSVAGVNVARVWIVVVQVGDDGLMSVGGSGGGGIKARLTLGLDGRAVTFGFGQEGDEPVERKRPSSSSTGVEGTMDWPLFSDDFGACETLPGWTRRVLAVEVDERPNMSSGSTGRVSRSESPSRSESGGTKDFLRRGDGVSACELYLLRKGRDEGIEEEAREGWCWARFC